MGCKELQWDEKVQMLSIHPDAAEAGDVARLAAELMKANHKVLEQQRQIDELTELHQGASQDVINGYAIIQQRDAVIERLKAEHDALNFWKDIILTEDGKLDVEQVQKELHDFYWMMENVPAVYMHITDGRISKPNTNAACVISEADDILSQLIESAVKEAELPLKKEVQRLSRKIEHGCGNHLCPVCDGKEVS